MQGIFRYLVLVYRILARYNDNQEIIMKIRIAFHQAAQLCVYFESSFIGKP
jgi:hypothetical protein